jgi:hypothetical protein
MELMSQRNFMAISSVHMSTYKFGQTITTIPFLGDSLRERKKNRERGRKGKKEEEEEEKGEKKVGNLSDD